MNAQPRDPSRKLALFYRDYRQFSGGHLKVWDYFNHVRASTSHEPRIAFSADSRWDSTNPWLNARDFVFDWQPETADLLFLAGTDWRVVNNESSTRPIINLIQHPRHAEPGSELRSYLRRRAVRICVSPEVTDAIEQTGEANGPVLTISNGIDLSAFESEKTETGRSIDVLICGLKSPELANDVARELSGPDLSLELAVEWMPRPQYIAKLCAAKIAVFVPRPNEGFYLPALEGMAAGAVVVCPDCFGNRSFCRDRVNCFRPELKAEAIVGATRAAMAQAPEGRRAMIEQAAATAQQHSLATERAEFLRILSEIDSLF